MLSSYCQGKKHFLFSLTFFSGHQEIYFCEVLEKGFCEFCGEALYCEGCSIVMQ